MSGIDMSKPAKDGATDDDDDDDDDADDAADADNTADDADDADADANADDSFGASDAVDDANVDDAVDVVTDESPELSLRESICFNSAEGGSMVFTQHFIDLDLIVGTMFSFLWHCGESE
eukprot:scaffold125149_cov59-Cyclotella_meneghiniana.AAC.1